VIQSTDESGPIQIRATSSGLKQVVLNIQSR
jgi:hypothetical protein